MHTTKLSHLFAYTYVYQPKFKFLALNLELILGHFHRSLFFSHTFRSLRIYIYNLFINYFHLQIYCLTYFSNKPTMGLLDNMNMCIMLPYKDVLN